MYCVVDVGRCPLCGQWTVSANGHKTGLSESNHLNCVEITAWRGGVPCFSWGCFPVVKDAETQKDFSVGYSLFLPRFVLYFIFSFSLRHFSTSHRYFFFPTEKEEPRWRSSTGSSPTSWSTGMSSRARCTWRPRRASRASGIHSTRGWWPFPSAASWWSCLWWCWWPPWCSSCRSPSSSDTISVRIFSTDDLLGGGRVRIFRFIFTKNFFSFFSLLFYLTKMFFLILLGEKFAKLQAKWLDNVKPSMWLPFTAKLHSDHQK